MEKNPKTYYPHLHAFRGFAILNIVAAHSWVMLTLFATQMQVPAALSPLIATSETIFHNGTIYFAIVSGLIFSLILKDYSWKKFYFAKMKNVVTPYIIFSIIFAFLMGMVMIPPGVEPLTTNVVLNALPLHILTGSSSGHMWYIPVLLILFVMTPLFKVVVNNDKCLPILVVILILPLVISRSWPDFTWQNVAFFVSPYVLGMLIGNNYKQTLVLAEKYQCLLWLITTITTAILLYLYLVEFEPIGVIKLQESLGYIQKVSICLIVLTVMHRNEDKLPRFFTTLGDYSFSIYFIHMIFIVIWAVIMTGVGLTTANAANLILTGCLLFILTLMTSIGFAWIIKKISGKYSRLFIGS
jgi:peptidoglycan/LPS O-acetylase OafA/YrhL